MTRQDLRASLTLVVFMAVSMGAQAQTFTTLHTFCSRPNCPDGYSPGSGLVQATDGNFYGRTSSTIFKIAPNGVLTTLHRFDGKVFSYGTLIQVANGDFFGTTFNGGVYSAGSVFRMTPSGEFRTLYSFRDKGASGNGPLSGLVQAMGGELYGTTEGYADDSANAGTVFKITPDGSLTTLYTFGVDGSNLAFPSGLILDTDGYLHGTTELGGSAGDGIAFKMTLEGALTTQVNFGPPSTVGEEPLAGVIQAGNGDFYGTTNVGSLVVHGVSHSDEGTVYRLSQKGTVSTIYAFDESAVNGANPRALIQASDGNLYGIAIDGGVGAYCPSSTGCGTIFKLTPAGKMTTVYNLCSQPDCRDGYETALLVQGTDGNLYGTNTVGGANNAGTVFRISLGLAPFVITQTLVGRVGDQVSILGTDLAGTTSVTFNGIAGVFTVNSTGSAISTTVPVGASTGLVQVVTPGGTLSTNVKYTVR